MNRKEYALYTAAVAAVMGAIIGYSAATGNVLLLFLGFAAGIVMLYLGRRRVTEVIEDERIYRISEKASRNTIQVFGIAIALFGATLIALRASMQIALTLAYSAIALVLLYMVFYAYYSRRALD